MQRTIIIGDVHGCPDELQDLLKACGFGRGDQLVFVGDLVAKGPDSQAVVQLAREYGAIGVRGNHDHHVLSWHHAQANPHRKSLKPLHQKVADSLKPEDWKWIESLPFILPLPRFRILVVHAGFVPGVPLHAQRAEHLLNIRSMTSENKPSKRIHDGTAWASLWKGPQQAVFGHDAMRGLQQHPYAIGIDTGCVYGNQLTAFIVPDRRIVSVPARRAYCDPK